jgi:geranylgeranyl diphosphate synthase type I
VVPDSVRDIAKRVEARIGDLLCAETARWAGVDPLLEEPLTALQQLALAGGKRLRPAFCVAAYVGAGGAEDDPAVVDGGAALELLHLFALIHDDVMDASARRRGMATIHTDFAARHGLAQWTGEDRRFGEGVAILVGDLAFVYADLLLRDAPAAAHDVFTELRLEVNVGQYLDLRGAVAGDDDVETARRIALYKSGKYTVERPLHLGAALAGRLDDLDAPLTAYGVPLGEAFQLRDDVLGAFGDSAVTGKPVGEDIREGKPTRLRAWAVAAGGSGAALLKARYGAADLSAEDLAALQEALVDSGALARAEAEIERLVDAALGALDAMVLAGDGRARLEDLAAFVAQRVN